MSTTFKVEAHRSDKWWALETPDAPGAVSQARRLDQAADMAREAISMITGLDEADVHVEVVPMLDAATNRILERFHQARSHVEEASAESAASARRAAHALQASGLPMRDIGQIMHLSHQRIHQLLAEPT